MSGVPSAAALSNIRKFWDRYNAVYERLKREGKNEQQARYQAMIAADRRDQ